MPIQVYLDSSDYSTLSNPSGLSDQLLTIKDKLLSWSKSNEVVFRFSAAHIIEMAPVEVKAVGAAEARASFLSELCGKNCLISFDQLMFNEIEKYSANSDLTLSVFSDDGTWFPYLADGIFSLFDEDRISPESFLPKFDNLSREARRRASKEFFKNGKLRPEIKNRILNDTEGPQAILAQFPMRKRDADTLLRYMVGEATKADADDAFYASLRDPKWMTQWFRCNPEEMSPVIEWLRGPAQQMHVAMKPIAETSKNLRDFYMGNSNDSSEPPEMSRKALNELKERWLHSISKTILDSNSIPHPEFSPERLKMMAPGFSTSISVMADVVWASASKTPRESMASDFVDVVHSMYAPYVDVYRTDGFMSPLVTQYVKSHGTTVVAKLTTLVGIIEARLCSDKKQSA